jgi:hypothetical protein
MPDKYRTPELDVLVLNHYLNVTRSTRKTANYFHISHVTVLRVLHHFGITQLVTAVCPWCSRQHLIPRPARGRKLKSLCPQCVENERFNAEVLARIRGQIE